MLIGYKIQRAPVNLRIYPDMLGIFGSIRLRNSSGSSLILHPCVIVAIITS
jgi:hypothetical protein